MNFQLKKVSDLSKDEIKLLNEGTFLDSSTDWKYSKESRAYYQEYFPNYIDLSFVVFAGGKIIAISYVSKGEKIDFYGMPAKVFIKEVFRRKKVIQTIIDYLIDIADGENIRLYYDSFMFYEINENNNFFYRQIEEYSYIINLNNRLDLIKLNFRKSYKSLINWCLKNINYDIIDINNFAENEFYLFKEFHIKTAGRKTRSDRSWELQLDMIRKGKAYLINGYYNDELVSSSFFFNGIRSYYAVAVYDRALMVEKLGIAHGSVFEAIKYLKENNSEILTLGSWEGEAKYSHKESQILKFKRGFTNEIELRNILEFKSK